MSHQRYFNFPVCLLKDFLTDSDAVLTNICRYSVYDYARREFPDECGEVDRNSYQTACGFYDVDYYYSNSFIFEFAEETYRYATFHAPKVGINTDVFWDFYSNEKTEFEKVCLLAFLAMKSILGTKNYCKTDNKYLLSRMNGSACSEDFYMLPEELAKYANEYQVKKIKNELKNNWGLKTYSRYTRGFYISFSLSLETLMYEAEKNRKANKLKQQKLEEKALLEKVLNKLASQGH